MRAAPAVQLRVAPPAGWRLACQLVAGLSAAAFAAWLAPRTGIDASWLQAGCAAAAAGVAALAAPTVLPAGRGQLRWDGGSWHWRADGAAERPGGLRPAIDAGRALLVHWQPDGAGRGAWLALAARQFAAADWHALRVAVHARRPAALA